jgi:hypothetical protein
VSRAGRSSRVRERAPRRCHLADNIWDGATGAACGPLRPRPAILSSGRESRGRGWLALGLALVAVPFATLGAAVAIHGGPAHQTADNALIVIAARDALHFHQLVGPYSRYGWHHSGPSYFYLLALPVWALGGGTGSELGVVAIGLLSSVAVVVLAHRLGGGRTPLWAAAALCAVFAGPPAATWRNPWNPYVVVFPMAAVLVAAAGAALGDRWSWVVAVVAGSFVIQTHIGTLPVVTVALILAGAMRLASYLRQRVADRSQGLPELGAQFRGVASAMAILMGALVALWLPTLIDQWGGTGNLSHLVRFFTTAHPQHTWHDAWRTATTMVALTTFGAHAQFHDGLPPLHPLAISLTFVAATAATGIVGWRRHRPFCLTLAAMAFVAALVSTLAITRVVGYPYKYLVLWVSVLPVPLIVGAGHALDWSVGPMSGLRSDASRQSAVSAHTVRRAGIAGLIVLGLVVPLGLEVTATLRALHATPLARDNDPDIAKLWQLASQVLDRRLGPVRIEIVAAQRWPAAAGLVLDSERHGIPVRVEQNWTFMFGQSRQTNFRERQVLLVAASDPSTWPQAKSDRLVGIAGADSLFAQVSAGF